MLGLHEGSIISTSYLKTEVAIVVVAEMFGLLSPTYVHEQQR